MISSSRLIHANLIASMIFASVGLAVAQSPTTPTFRIPSCETFEAYGQQGGAHQASVSYEFNNYLHLDPSRLSDAEFRALDDAITKCLLTRTSPFAYYLNYARRFLRSTKSYVEKQRVETAARVDKDAEISKILETSFAQLTRMSSEIDKLPSEPESVPRLSELIKQIQEAAPKCGTGLPGLQFQLCNKIHDTANQLEEKISAKMTLARRSEFIAAARSASTKHSKDIASLNFPAKALDATIFFQQAQHENSRFITLRQLLALLLGRDDLRVTGVGNGTQYGVAVKRPGERTLVFVFQFDDQDAFLDGIVVGDVEQRLDNSVKQAEGEKMLRDLVNASMWQ